MRFAGARGITRSRVPLIAMLALAATIGLAGCDGDNGKDGGLGPTGPSGGAGPTGPAGPSGPAAPGATVPIASDQYASIIPAISKVTVPADGRPVVEFSLKDEQGRPLSGLAPGNVRFVITRLKDGANGKSSEWQAYTRTTAQPGTGSWPGTKPENQSTAEVATATTLTELGLGKYSFKFNTNITTVDDLSTAAADTLYSASAVHRVGLEIRSYPQALSLRMSNAPFTFRPSTGEVLAQSGREIVDNDTCNACHDVLEFHGGPRTDVQYCVTCHDPYTKDPQSTNTVDMKVMIHKIHSSSTLPSVGGLKPAPAPACTPNGTRYGIYGFGNTFADYTCLPYPELQDLRNCTTCHQESDADTPQASNWRLTVNSAACGACHDDVNFATGANHPRPAGGIVATDAECANCHGPASTFGLKPDDVHKVPDLEAGKKFKYEVVSITNTAPGQFPVVTIKVVDPTNNNAPYDLTAPNNPFVNSQGSLRVDIAYATTEITNRDASTSGAQGQPFSITFVTSAALQPGVTKNADGSFTRTSTTAMPAVAKGSGLAIIEGRAAVELDGVPGLTSADRVPIAAAGIPFKITDATAVPRRKVVNISRCDDCHKPLSIHGDARSNNTELCSACHNSLMATRGGTGITDPTRPEASVDLKYLAHALHAGIYQGNNWGFDEGSEYPGKLANCLGCHEGDTYYPVDATKVLGSTFLRGPLGGSVYTDDVAVTPNATVCGGCHIKDMVGVVNGTTTDPVAAHMEANGASFSATRNADGTLIGPIEACSVCHGPGRTSDVKAVHKVGEYRYNP